MRETKFDIKLKKKLFSKMRPTMADEADAKAHKPDFFLSKKKQKILARNTTKSFFKNLPKGKVLKLVNRIGTTTVSSKSMVKKRFPLMVNSKEYPLEDIPNNKMKQFSLNFCKVFKDHLTRLRGISMSRKAKLLRSSLSDFSPFVIRETLGFLLELHRQLNPLSAKFRMYDRMLEKKQRSMFLLYIKNNLHFFECIEPALKLIRKFFLVKDKFIEKRLHREAFLIESVYSTLVFFDAFEGGMAFKESQSKSPVTFLDKKVPYSSLIRYNKRGIKKDTRKLKPLYTKSDCDILKKVSPTLLKFYRITSMSQEIWTSATPPAFGGTPV